jgi:serine/threonine protein kinase
VERLRADDPEEIGPYKLIARLGSGGMGVVFLGTKGSKRVAIKVVRSSFLDDPSLRTRFSREIETLQKIKSPHLAQIVAS